MLQRSFAPAAMLAAMLAGTAAGAQEQVYRLSPAQRDAAIAAGAQRTDTDTPALLPTPGLAELSTRSLYDDADAGKPDKKIHGEVGMFVGTGGTRGIFGTAVVPLGENATASLSFSHGQGRGLGFGGFGGGFGGFGGFGYGYSPYDFPGIGLPMNRRFAR